MKQINRQNRKKYQQIVICYQHIRLVVYLIFMSSLFSSYFLKKISFNFWIISTHVQNVLLNFIWIIYVYHI
mgnify:CR=1 FL=1